MQLPRSDEGSPRGADRPSDSSEGRRRHGSLETGSALVAAVCPGCLAPPPSRLVLLRARSPGNAAIAAQTDSFQRSVATASFVSRQRLPLDWALRRTSDVSATLRVQPLGRISGLLGVRLRGLEVLGFSWVVCSGLVQDASVHPGVWSLPGRQAPGGGALTLCSFSLCLAPLTLGIPCVGCGVLLGSPGSIGGQGPRFTPGCGAYPDAELLERALPLRLRLPLRREFWEEVRSQVHRQTPVGGLFLCA